MMQVWKRLLELLLIGAGYIGYLPYGNIAGVEYAGGDAYIEPVFADWGSQVTPSVGTVCFPFFSVEFQDVKYTSDKASQEELTEWIFTGEDSVAAYYEEASYGRLHLEGDVYTYTAQGTITSYEDNTGYERLIMEVLTYFDDEVDYSRYDANGDNVIDAVVISVPSGGDVDFWWAFQLNWYQNPDFTVDGLSVMNYVVNDEQPYEQIKDTYKSTLEHELGHCMGIPDLYKYDAERSWEGMEGIAGIERMDESSGDFSQFTKLQLGWLRREQVMVMPPHAQSVSYLLPPAHEGGCILIFPEGKTADFQSEYLLIEYNMSAGLMADVISEAQAGVRILHVCADIMEDMDGYYYRYENYSPYYDHSDEGRRLLSLVNDRKFYHTGDIVSYERTGGAEGKFGWYSGRKEVADPQLAVYIGEVRDDGIEIRIERGVTEDMLPEIQQGNGGGLRLQQNGDN